MRPVALAALAEVELALGNHEAARSAAEEAIADAEADRLRIFEITAQRALVRVLLAGADADGKLIDATQKAATSALARIEQLIAETGARAFEPALQRERERLARNAPNHSPPTLGAA